ncbi:FHA domain-containing protein [Candidatus Woesearchaeota archaeon]|nr:FHA domain-containing protein [Candidatus Woesearchaeota archaeon]
MVTLFGIHLFEKGKAQLVFDNNLVIPLYEDKVIMVEKIGNKITVASSGMTARLSRTHAVLRWDREASKYLFEDTSSYGSVVAGRPIHRGKILLADKDKINLQGLRFMIIYS